MKNSQAMLVLAVLLAVALGAVFSVLKSNPAVRQAVSGPSAPDVTSAPNTPPAVSPAGSLMIQAAHLNRDQRTVSAKQIYDKLSKEHPQSFFADVAGTRLAEPGLEGFAKSLNESNSETYVVQYGDNLDKIARKYRVTAGTIMAANGLTRDLIRPNQKLKIPREKWSLIADKSTHMMVLKSGNQVVKTYPIGIGKEDSTPLGSFKIVTRLKNPTWYHDGVVAKPGTPENPLGTRWMGFDLESYGLHGTTEPDSIGQSKSLGCIRMLNPEVEELFELVGEGTPITVIESARTQEAPAATAAVSAPQTAS